MPKAFGFSIGIKCPKCGKWARVSTTLSVTGKRKASILVINCSHCSFRKEIRSLKSTRE